jgi:hypothetical protein
MLYFSETAWTLPDIVEVNDAFDREYDQAEYEKKIGALARNFRDWADNADPSELESWDEAIRAIGAEDHYLLVLLKARKESTDSPLVDRLRLVALAFVIAVAFLVAQFFLRKR